jgi:PAS domain S-box-containing protein
MAEAEHRRTAYMEEALGFDWLVAMNGGRVLATGAPQELLRRTGTAALEESFIACLEEAAVEAQSKPLTGSLPTDSSTPLAAPTEQDISGSGDQWFSLRRLFSYSRREALELRRDPIRLTLALLGSVILILVMGFGITMDVEDLAFAVLDRDQTGTSRDYTLNLAGAVFGRIYPTTHFLTISRGTFAKALDFSDLHASFIPLALAVPVNYPVRGVAQKAGALKCGSPTSSIWESRSCAVSSATALDEARTTLFINPQVESLLGFDQADFYEGRDTWNNWLHPEDKERVLKELSRCRKENDLFICEYRMLTFNGYVKWIRDEAATVLSDAGEPLFIQGVMADITEQKKF